MTEKKKFNYMENNLQHVIKKIISLNSEDIKRNNKILQKVIEEMIKNLKEVCPLFRALYQRNFFGGSYYDGLKVGKPEEYDIDLLLKVPKNTETVLSVIDDVPGFVSLRVKSAPGDNTLNEFRELLDGEYLSTTKVLRWMERIVSKAIKLFPQDGSQAVITIEENKYWMKVKKSGPAFTLNLVGEEGSVNFDVDLVPCFICGNDLWPKQPFRSNPRSEKPNFFIVPKQPSNSENHPIGHCWRLSFQEQEQVLINGCQKLKPAIKLLKKLRDTYEQKCISSYFIKTVVLWEVEKRESSFWDCSLSYVFIELLQVLRDKLLEGNIPYYWNDKNNLLKNMEPIVLSNYGNRFKKTCYDIIRKEDAYFVASLFLSEPDLVDLPTPKKVTTEEEVVRSCSVKSNGANIEYATILSKLEAVNEESKLISSELKELRNENKQLHTIILGLSDKIGLLSKKLAVLDTQPAF